GDRQYAAVVALAVRAAVYDGRGDRQRIRRGGRQPAPVGAGRDRPRAVRHHADRELAVAAADLEHGAHERHGGAGAEGAAYGGGGVNRTHFRKLMSSLFVVLDR